VHAPLHPYFHFTLFDFESPPNDARFLLRAYAECVTGKVLALLLLLNEGAEAVYLERINPKMAK